MYRFKLKQGNKAILPLELGQEVTFVGLDDRNRPVRASFPLASGRREPGYVEIVARRSRSSKRCKGSHGRLHARPKSCC